MLENNDPKNFGNLNGDNEGKSGTPKSSKVKSTKKKAGGNAKRIRSSPDDIKKDVVEISKLAKPLVGKKRLKKDEDSSEFSDNENPLKRA